MHGTIPVADAVEVFLDRAKAQGFRSKIEAAFERADKLKIAFVGETIIDEYRYVLPLAKPSKEFIVASVEAREPEEFLGGVVAAGRHGDWINARNVVAPNVVRKTRFVDADFTRKLFEVYSATDIGLVHEQRERFQGRLIEAARDYDVMVVLDFGHGLMGPQERHIAESAKFLAVNAQTNAGNAGFNPVTKYQRADYVCVDLPEARLAACMQGESSAPLLVKRLRESIRCDRWAITCGRSGSSVCEPRATVDNRSMPFNFLYDADIPAFATQGLDTIGAGDAFLAVSAPLVAAGLELEAAAFVGNVAGAIKVSIVGHRAHVTRAALMSKIAELLA